MEAKKAIIVTIGDELLMGQVLDTNSPWIAGQLELIGVQTIRRWAIPDDAPTIFQTLDQGTLLADYLIITGGLGPTKDDLTKAALNQYFGGKLTRDEAAFQHILKIFSERNRELNQANEDQALVPDNCRVLQNPVGTAPGMWFDKEGKAVIALPGVPYEMKAIFSNSVLPEISKRNTGFFRQHRHFLLMNASETVIAQKIEAVEKALPEYIKLAYLPGLAGLRLRLTGSHFDKNRLSRELDSYTLEIENILGDKIADEHDWPIESVVGQLLQQKHWKLGLAESCTGGLIAHKITNVPGSSAYFNGGIVSYDNKVKIDLLAVPEETLLQEGAVSEATVLQMAVAAKEQLRSDIALAISGILGPAGGSPEKPVGTVWMAIADAAKAEAKKFNFYYDRARNKELAANTALEWLRKWLLTSKAG